MAQFEGKSSAVRARAPLRLGFAGGGTDLSPFCDEHGGYVMNATLSLFAYAHLSKSNTGRSFFAAADQAARFEFNANDGPVALDPGTLLHCGVYNRMIAEFNRGEPLAVDVTTMVDVPAGSGLGGSSALVVALVEAFRRFLRLPLGEYDIARIAVEIEREELEIAGGKQDQYAAAFGGFNFMEFYGEGRVIINPLRISPATIQELEASLVLYYTGRSRGSATVVSAQQDKIKQGNQKTMDAMEALKREAVGMKEALLTSRFDRIAETMRSGWLAKKATADTVSNTEIERVLDLALANGALAGKVSGAGGGGFVLILCDPLKRHSVAEALSKEPGRLLPTTFTNDGAKSWQQVF